MRTTCRLVMLTAFVLGAVPAGHATPPPQSGGQTPQVFSTRVTAVPIDVRAIDRAGRPVTDLKAEEVRVYEDGVRQTISLFASQILTAGVAGPAARARADVPGFDGAPQKRRVFLIVIGTSAFGTQPLGPGTTQLPDPSAAADGVAHLLNELLLPQDQVALLANNRATDFTTDHRRIASIVLAFRESRAAGMAALAKDSLQAPLHADVGAESHPLPDQRMAGLGGEVGFAEYVRSTSGSASDAERLLYGISYLRYMEGEKHLLFLVEQGLIEPVASSLESALERPELRPRRLAEAAADGRVAVHSIQTGGIPGEPGSFHAPIPVMTPLILVEGQTCTSGWSARTNRGGQASETCSGPTTGRIRRRGGMPANPRRFRCCPGWTGKPPRRTRTCRRLPNSRAARCRS